MYLHQYHCIPHLQHLVEGQYLCPAENWVKFLILQEGTWRLVLTIMEGQNKESYVGGSISFRPDIQRPHPNAKCSEGYIEPSIVRLLYQFQVATCSSMLEALVLVGSVVVSC